MSSPIFRNRDNHSNESSNSAFPSTEKTEQLFKDRYEAEHVRKENLDKKANNLLVGGTTVVTIFGGIGILSQTNFLNDAPINDISIIVLVLGLVSVIIGIIISSWAVKLRGYWKVIVPNDYGVILNDKFFLEKRPDDLRNTDSVLLSAMIINAYIEMTVRNEKINEGKAKQIDLAQYFFIAGIISIPVFILSLAWF